MNKEEDKVSCELRNVMAVTRSRGQLEKHAKQHIDHAKNVPT